MRACRVTRRPTPGLVAAALLGGACLPLACARAVPADLLTAPPAQAQAYSAEVPKGIVDLQQFRRTQSLEVAGPGGRKGVATLVNLNPVVNAWYLLTLRWTDGTALSYHLENAVPQTQELVLDPGSPAGPMVLSGAERAGCDLWSSAALDDAARRDMPFVPLCGGTLYLRNPVQGHRTDVEAVADFLRDHVWGGESIVGLAKDTVFRDAQLERAKLARAAHPSSVPPSAPVRRGSTR